MNKHQAGSPIAVFDEVQVELEDIHIVYQVQKQDQYEAIAEQGFVVLLDCVTDASMLDEGLVHEITSRVQKVRKEAKLVPTDNITIFYAVEPKTSEIARVAEQQTDEIEALLKKKFVALSMLDKDAKQDVVIDKKFQVKDGEIQLVIVKHGAQSN